MPGPLRQHGGFPWQEVHGSEVGEEAGTLDKGEGA